MMLLLQPQTRLPLSVQQQRRVPLTRRAALASYSRYSCIHEQPRAAAPVPACFLRSTRQATARQLLHICSACADPGEGSQDGLIALQDPQGSHTAAYVVGVRPGAPGDGLSQIQALVSQLKQQGQQEVLLLLDSDTANERISANPVQAASDALPTPPLQQWQGRQELMQGSVFQACLEATADFHSMELQVRQPMQLSQQQQQQSAGLTSPAGAQPSSYSPISSSSANSTSTASSSSSSSTGWSGLLASGLGLARRTATAAATAVEAAAAVWSQEDSSSVELRPDLPDYSLRMRSGDWPSEEVIAYKWHAAVLLCSMIKQLEDAGYEVELRGPGDRGGGIGVDVDDGDLQVLEPSNDREKAAFHSFQIVRLLLAEASDQQMDDMVTDEEEVQQWLAVLLAAEDPKVVVSELESMITEALDERTRLQELGLPASTPPPPLPGPLDVVRRLDARYDRKEDDRPTSTTSRQQPSKASPDASSQEGQHGTSSSSNSSSSAVGSSDTSSSGEAAAAAAAEGGVEDAGEADTRPSSSSSSADGDATSRGAGNKAASSASSTSSTGGDSTATTSSSSSGGSNSSAGLDASDDVISVRSDSQLIQAMMRLERSWTRAADADSSSSGGGSSRGRGGSGVKRSGVDQGSSSSSSSGGGGGGGGGRNEQQAVPELLPRPIRPPQPKSEADTPTSSSSSGGVTDAPSSTAGSSNASDAASSSDGSSSAIDTPSSSGSSGGATTTAADSVVLGDAAAFAAILEQASAAGPPAAAGSSSSSISGDAAGGVGQGSQAEQGVARSRVRRVRGTDAPGSTGSTSSSISTSSSSSSSSNDLQQQQEPSQPQQEPRQQQAEQQPQQLQQEPQQQQQHDRQERQAPSQPAAAAATGEVDLQRLMADRAARVAEHSPTQPPGQQPPAAAAEAPAADSGDAPAAAAAVVGADDGSATPSAAAGSLNAADVGSSGSSSAVAEDATAASGSSESAASAAGPVTAAAAAEPGDDGADTDDDDSDSETELSKFEAHIRSEFARFEEYLVATGAGASLSREARIEAFVEIYLDSESSSSGDDSDAGDDGSDSSNAASSPSDVVREVFRVQDNIYSSSDEDDDGLDATGREIDLAARAEWLAAIVAQILSEDPEPGSSGFVGRDTSSSSSGSTGDVQDPSNKQQQSPDAPQQPGSSRSHPRSSASNSVPSGPGWEQLRANFGQDGVDRLQELLRADSLRMSNMELTDVLALSEAFNSMLQGEKLSTTQLRMVSRMLKEAEASSNTPSSSSGASDATGKAAGRGSRRQQRGAGGSATRRSASLARPPGFNVSAKDPPYEQDTSSVRRPRPYGRRRRERTALLLKQLRLRGQQLRQVKQQRATQLQLWRLQQQQQRQMQDGDGAALQQQPLLPGSSGEAAAAGGGSSSRGDGVIRSSSSSGTRGRLADAFRGFKAAWKQSMAAQEANQQQQQAMPSAASAAADDDMQAAVKWVQQLQKVLAGEELVPGEPALASRAVIVVVPYQQLQLIEAAWDMQQGASM